MTKFIFTEDEKVFFAMYFGQIVGIQYHPANPSDKRMPLEQAAHIAKEMVMLQRGFFKED